MTPPAPEAEGENSPQSEAEYDPKLKLILAQNRKTRRQLREKVQSMTKKAALQEETVKALKRHIESQATSIASANAEKGRLLVQCQKFAALLRMLPSGMVDEEMLSETPFTMVSYEAAGCYV